MKATEMNAIVMSRKQAAQELMAVYNAYEFRPIKLATAYRRVYRTDVGTWRLNGYAQDYIV